MSTAQNAKSNSLAKNHAKDAASERSILSGLLCHGSDAYYTITEYISQDDFFFFENRIIFSTIAKLIIEDGIPHPDANTIINLVPDDFKGKYDYISALSETYVDKEAIPTFCKIVGKLSVTRQIQYRLTEALSKIENISGEETLKEILDIGENAISAVSSKLVNNNDIVNLASNIDSFVEFLSTDNKPCRGVPSGFPIWDSKIGGGLRKPGVHLVGGRAKAGKSQFALVVAKNISELNIPVLYLDTELTDQIVMTRLLANVSDTLVEQLESGLFKEDSASAKKVSLAASKIKKFPFYYLNIASQKHKDWISACRQWVMKEVGIGPDGNIKDCLIVLDYIKTMDLGDMGNAAEWQYLGQVITDLHNFCVKYNLPILSFVQLNRLGIENNDQGVIAGSDRLIALCSSFSIMRNKSPEDLADDPLSNGNKKMIVVASRFGKGSEDGEYINLQADFSKSQIFENETNVNNRIGRAPKKPSSRLKPLTEAEDDYVPC